MAPTLLGNIKTFINQCLPDYIINSWSSTAQTGKAPSESLVKTALNGKSDTGHTHLPDVGTFTELQTLITNATAPSGEVPIIILDKDYKYDSTTDSSLTNGISITKNITIIGNGHIIDGNNSTRAFLGQARCIWELNDLTIQNCAIEEGNGGAICLTNNNNSTINNCILKNNNSTYSGGAIYANDDCILNITDCTFDSNTVEDGMGGALYVYDSQLNIIGSTVINNAIIGGAYPYGGGIYFGYTQANIIGNTIIGNKVNGSYTGGGGIYIDWGSSTKIIGNNITKNIGNGTYGSGGGIYNNSQQTIIKDSIIKTNNASTYVNIFSYQNITINNCDINDMSTTCYHVTSKDYLTDHQTLPTASTSQAGIVQLGTTSDKAAQGDHTHSNYLTSHQDISGKIDTAGTGLSKTGTTLNHSNSITAITTAAFKKIKYDAQGHITGTSNVAAGDLPSHTHNYTTTSDVDTEIESYMDAVINEAGTGSNNTRSYIIDLIYPVGAIYISTVATSPAILFGGTWTSIGQGKTLIGTGTNDGTTYTAGSTGGEKTHTLTESELPSISATFGKHGQENGTDIYNITGKATGTKMNNQYKAPPASTSGAYSYTNPGIAFGGGQSHNNMPPYLVVYMWERTE